MQIQLMSVVFIFSLSLGTTLSEYYGYSYNYEAKDSKMEYVPVLQYRKQPTRQPVRQIVEENLALKYFDLFLSNPYEETGGNETSEIYNRYRVNLTAIQSKCPRDSFFSSYNPTHKGAVSALSQLYNDQSEFRNLIELGQFFKTQLEVHPSVWYTSFIRGQLSRMPETLAMQRPSPIYLFPSSFFTDRILQETTQSSQECIYLDERFGEDNGIENALWYFREDVQMNAHHWIWHLLYPLNSTEPIDRRGEFFYFFHHELVARYETERIANGLQLQTPFNVQINSVVEEGYNPHLMNGISTQSWAPRPPFQNLATVLNTTTFGDLVNLTIRKDRVIEALLGGSVFRGDRNIPIHTFDSINILGELTEASNHSINPPFYGMDGYHNEGHFIFANLIGDSPEGTMGVMGDVATAMRDPIFYQWHKLIDIFFLAYKSTHLIPYQLNQGEHPLVFRGATVEGIQIIPEDSAGGTVNVLRTFWNAHRWNLEGGLDFNSQAGSQPPNVNICAKHLDHEEFAYRIQIDNNRATSSVVTVRIFMAPRFKSEKEKSRYTMNEQRIRFFSMDSFTTTLQPGENIVSRRSIDSTLTAPWPTSIQQTREEIRNNIRRRTDCECGYPHHLLLPKGTKKGMRFDLFVMVTDGNIDQVSSPQSQRPQQNFTIPECTPSHIHCGIPGGSYPDSRPMGYPFDRRPYGIPTIVRHPSGKLAIEDLEVASLEEYIRNIPNMATTKIVIFHQDIQLGLENLVPA